MALFGTDGIRGLANRDLTAELALDVSVAAAHILVESSSNKDHQPTAIVGQEEVRSNRLQQIEIQRTARTAVAQLLLMKLALQFEAALTCGK